jgi:hypothetical protein
LLGNKADLCSILQLMTSLFLVNGHFLGVEGGGRGMIHSVDFKQKRRIHA